MTANVGVIMISGMLYLISTSNWTRSPDGLGNAHSDEEERTEAADDGRELVSDLI